MKGFYHIRRGSHLGHVTQMPRTNLLPIPMEAPHTLLVLISQAVWEKMFEQCEWTTKMTDHGYAKSSPGEPVAKVS